MPSTPDWTAEIDQPWAHLGHAAASAGDVNGDGYADLIAGAAGYDSGEVDEGAAFLYLGTPAGLNPAPAWTAQGDQAYAYLGWSVAGAGDVDGDGYDDVIVGALGYDGGEIDEGRALLYRGTPDGLSATPAWTIEGDQAYANLGWSVAGAGDLNGDGYDDVVAGAPFYDSGQFDEGQVWVFYGSPVGLPSAPDWQQEGDQEGAFFGFSAAGGGDANGDGYADLLVGAYGYDNPWEREGRTYLFSGSSSGLAPTAGWIAESGQAGSCFALAVAGAGDLNGDGYSDLVVGAYLYDHRFQDEGAVFVYLGAEAGPSPAPNWLAYGGQESAFLGFAVGAAGDVDADGLDDLAVGAHSYDAGQMDEGRALVYLGAPGGLPALPDWTADGDQTSAHFGLPVRTAGDVNGDGLADLVVGASSYDAGQIDEGAVFVYHGIGSADLALTASVWPVPAEAGQPLTYTLTAGNAGPSPAAAPVLSKTLPLGATLRDATGPGWACALAGQALACGRTELLPGEAAPLTVVVTAPWETGLLTATAQLASRTADPEPLNNSVTLTTPVLCPPVVEARFTWEPQAPTAHELVIFRGFATSTLPLTFIWDLGDGTPSGGQVVTHTYTAPGVYPVTLTASSACASATATHRVTVAAPVAWRRVYLPWVSQALLAAVGSAGEVQ